MDRNAGIEYRDLDVIPDRLQGDEHIEQWCRKALEVFERLGMERDVADTCHHLGLVFQYPHQYEKRNDEAERWYRKAIRIFERLGPGLEASFSYHNLGIIEVERRHFDEAEQWFRKALDIRTGTQHTEDTRTLVELSASETLAQLGNLHREKGDLCDAVSSYGRALAIASGYDRRLAARLMNEIAAVMGDMGEAEFTTAWRQAFEGREPPLAALREARERPEPQATTNSPEQL